MARRRDRPGLGDAGTVRGDVALARDTVVVQNLVNGSDLVESAERVMKP